MGRTTKLSPRQGTLSQELPKSQSRPAVGCSDWFGVRRRENQTSPPRPGNMLRRQNTPVTDSNRDSACC